MPALPLTRQDPPRLRHLRPRDGIGNERDLIGDVPLSQMAVQPHDQIQVFDAKTFALAASIPVGKRCWHFSFTPDGKKALVACGRSDTLTVIDVATRQAVSTLTGFNQPWGIVTYPKSSGSLDSEVR